MKTIQFKCKLQSDIILSEQAATEGTQRTLDYIPGNVFLGLVAGKLYSTIKPEEAMDLFHSGKVRFGDAHPLSDEKRAVRVPASWQVLKGETIKDHVFIHHALSSDGIKDESVQAPTFKQCREEFIVKADANHFHSIIQEKNFAIKSAYDKDNRRSMNQQMYGYQSLEAGMEFCFQLEYDDSIADELINKVKDRLIGKRTIGRSKTAQYGQVEIENSQYKQKFSEEYPIESNCTYLYAESRLLFLDETGQPSACPTGEQLGMTDAKIDFNKSQIRTFRYAPYNFKRQTRDADRFGIEKGSVICINRSVSPDEAIEIKKGIGLYLNEGFGKVLINPEFLKSNSDDGKALFTYTIKAVVPIILDNAQKKVAENPIYKYLKAAKAEENKQQDIYSLVNDFVVKNAGLFQKDQQQFASQWGTIRLKAIQAKDFVEFQNALFLKANDLPEGYLVSGIAASKWEGKPIKRLKEFIQDIEPEIALETMINLSSEMAKLCQTKGGMQ